MPLIDLRTDLKSLKYGQDRPGGGNSGQPYVQYPLPEVASPDYLNFYQNNKYNLDFPLRGGGVSLGIDGPYVSQAAKYDQQRIARFLKDAPRGPIFLLKQVGLQLSNPKIQVGAQINPDLGVLPFRFLGNLENTRIYNGGLNTLAQVGVQGSGIHFNRHGMTPIGPYQQTYNYIANDKNNPATVETNIPTANRLYNLYRTKILSTGRIRLDDPTVDLETLNNLGISRNPDLLLQYPGGPSSVGGIGLTTIHRRDLTVGAYQMIPTEPTSKVDGRITYLSLPTGYSSYIQSGSRLEIAYNKVLLRTDTSDPNLYYLQYVSNRTLGGVDSANVRYNNTAESTDNSPQGTTVGTTNEVNFNYSYNYQLLSGQSKNTLSQIKQDFRKAILNSSSSYVNASNKLASTENYETDNNIATKYGVGNPGAKDFKRVSYNESKNIGGADVDITQDQINLLDVGQTGDTIDNRGHLKDLITFRFDTIEVDTTEKTPIVFRAFLSSLQDNNTAEYSPFKYVGRGENFYTYNGFTRSISFNFKVAPQSRSEMKPLYRKVNYLLSQLYPDYNTFASRGNTGFMRAPIIRVTIGDYIVAQPGFLTSMNITVPDDTAWEIANNQLGPDSDSDMYQLPQVLDVSCQFTPIHNFLPRRSWMSAAGAKITPLITPNVTGNVFGIGQ